MTAGGTPGHAFERRIELICDHYRNCGIADIRKVDPPTKTFGSGRATKVVHMANPWLDFTGCWKAQGGRMIQIEAKSTEEPVLRILKAGGGGGGISYNQQMNARRWADAGAAVAFLWHWRGDVRIVTPTMVEAQLTERMSLRWIDAHPVPAGTGFCFHDFLACMANLKRPPTTP